MSKKRIGAQTGKKNTQSDFVSLCGVRGVGPICSGSGPVKTDGVCCEDVHDSTPAP